MVSHESVVDALHAQPGTTVTAIDGPAPPPAATVAETSDFLREISDDFLTLHTCAATHLGIPTCP